MITKYKLKDIKQAIADEDFLYQYTTQIADKLRAIYTVFGWVHMLDSFDTVQNHIDELMSHVYKSLAEGKKNPTVQSAGLQIEGWVDEDDFVNIDYYFNLG